jgi:hypothetical protein
MGSTVSMRRLLAGILVAVFGCSTVSTAPRPCTKQSIETLVKAVDESFENKTLATLDAGRPYIGRFRFVIEHSLYEDNDPQRFETRLFRSLAQAEAWLNRREHDGMPGRATKPLVKCTRGVCTYNFDSGIVHNVIFLKRITFGVRNGCPYLKTIHLLDGD